ncbi:hypothetical protein D3C79_885800 [compost metagenome]
MVIGGPGDFAHLRGIKHLELLANAFKGLSVIDVQLQSPISGGRVDLPGRVERVGRHAVLPRGFSGKSNRKPILRDFQRRCRLTRHGVFPGRQTVRHIDHEARVSARRALGDFMSIDHNNAVTGV